MTSNLVEAVYFEKIVKLLVPNMFPVQKKILDNYIEDTKINNLSNCIVPANAARRSGTSLIAAAIALAESRINDNVLFVGESSIETTIIMKKLNELSELGRYSTLTIGHPDKSYIGQKFDVVIYESFMLKMRHTITDKHNRLAFATNADLIYTIHA